MTDDLFTFLFKLTLFTMFVWTVVQVALLYG